MLVLSRRSNETIVLGESIRVTVVAIRPDHVQIGIEAPREVAVYREETRRTASSAAETPPVEGSEEPAVWG
ncbi:MAG: carbon storage regulator [Planctomycetaceae bacterium]|nr:carbon storage regulator [Planctomycetaceae bacterium]